jgi:hypothetical protein
MSVQATGLFLIVEEAGIGVYVWVLTLVNHDTLLQDLKATSLVAGGPRPHCPTPFTILYTMRQETVHHHGGLG